MLGYIIQLVLPSHFPPFLLADLRDDLKLSTERDVCI